MTDPTYGHVCRMDYPRASIRNLATALALITETIEEVDASAMNAIIHTLLGHIGDLDGVYSTLFRLHHPSRERFEREGWPGGKVEVPQCT